MSANKTSALQGNERKRQLLHKRDDHHKNNDDRGDEDHSKAKRTNSILGRMVGSGMSR